jgi:hypothetical protein
MMAGMLVLALAAPNRAEHDPLSRLTA